MLDGHAALLVPEVSPVRRAVVLGEWRCWEDQQRLRSPDMTI